MRSESLRLKFLKRAGTCIKSIACKQMYLKIRKLRHSFKKSSQIRFDIPSLKEFWANCIRSTHNFILFSSIKIFSYHDFGAFGWRNSGNKAIEEAIEKIDEIKKLN